MQDELKAIGQMTREQELAEAESWACCHWVADAINAQWDNRDLRAELAEAREEIDRLRARLAELEAALAFSKELIASMENHGKHGDEQWMGWQARALEAEAALAERDRYKAERDEARAVIEAVREVLSRQHTCADDLRADIIAELPPLDSDSDGEEGDDCAFSAAKETDESEYCGGCGKKMIPSEDPAVELVCPDLFTESTIFHDIVSRELDAALDGIIAPTGKDTDDDR